MDTLTRRFLNELAEIFDSINIEGKRDFLDPTLAAVSSIILTGMAAFTSDIKLLGVIFVVGGILVLSSHSSFRIWIKIVTLITAYTLSVSIPAVFLIPGRIIADISFSPVTLRVSYEGVMETLIFTLRAAASASIFTAFTLVLGWRRLMDGLRRLRIPKEIIQLLIFSIIYIPLFLKEALKMLSAREARIMRRIKLRDTWKVLATVIGDLMLRSYEVSWRLEKAVRARTFTSEQTIQEGFRFRPPDLLLLLTALSLLTLKISAGI